MGCRESLEPSAPWRLLLGERFGAQRAFELGLVNQIVPAAALIDATSSMALRLATGPTRALGHTKRLINDSLGQSLSNQLLAEQDAFSACSTDEDFARGLQAFLDKCDPVFIGH
jgi:2-(1,2-epoxy-1,2-dihydrophenyl)acetyl-CoA isomerase